MFLLFKAKSEPRTAAPSAGPLKAKDTQPTSSTLANTVRIEKLSDEEDEEVDITDDPCNDDGDHKPPVDNVCESEVAEGILIHTEKSKEDQNKVGPATSLDHLFHTCCEGNGVSEKVSPRAHLQTAAPTTSELITQEDKCVSFQAESSQEPDLPEEGGSDETGKTAAVTQIP